MRAYFFGNMYLSSIQQGIQAAHAVSDMFVKYSTDSSDIERSLMLFEWAANHKTMILCNGGYGSNIRSLLNFFESRENPFPFAPFYEGEDALDGAITTVGIVLPERIYTTAALFRKYRDGSGDAPSPRQQIAVAGSLTILPRNHWGIKTDEIIEWTFTNWELELIDKLNTFDLAK